MGGGKKGARRKRQPVTGEGSRSRRRRRRRRRKKVEKYRVRFYSICTLLIADKERVT